MFEHYLRVYCNYKQNNWSKLLFMTMFTYNNNVYSNINQFFHLLLKNYIVILADISKNVIKGETLMITKRVEWLQISKKYFMNMWKKNRKIQIKYYDVKHITRVANGAVRCDQIRHRTDGASMHKIVHKICMHA